MSRFSAVGRIARLLALAAGLAAICLLPFAFGAFKVVGPSMEPGLGHDEYLVVEKISYAKHEPLRGDIIVFHDPRDREQTFIKRLIGLPGDRVEIVDGSLLLNGKPVREPYLDSAFLPDFSHPKLAEDQYFALGDNRALSKDSRNYGPIRRKDIIGRAWIVYSSPLHWRRVPHLMPDFSIHVSTNDH